MPDTVERYVLTAIELFGEFRNSAGVLTTPDAVQIHYKIVDEEGEETLEATTKDLESTPAVEVVSTGVCRFILTPQEDEFGTLLFDYQGSEGLIVYGSGKMRVLPRQVDPE